MLTLILILSIIFAIFLTLFLAIPKLFKGHKDSNELVKALTIRVSLALLLFFLLFILMSLGLIRPHGIIG